jgi:hypothetical protein
MGRLFGGGGGPVVRGIGQKVDTSQKITWNPTPDRSAPVSIDESNNYGGDYGPLLIPVSAEAKRREAETQARLRAAEDRMLTPYRERTHAAEQQRADALRAIVATLPADLAGAIREHVDRAMEFKIKLQQAENRLSKALVVPKDPTSIRAWMTGRRDLEAEIEGLRAAREDHAAALPPLLAQARAHLLAAGRGLADEAQVVAEREKREAEELIASVKKRVGQLRGMVLATRELAQHIPALADSELGDLVTTMHAHDSGKRRKGADDPAVSPATAATLVKKIAQAAIRSRLKDIAESALPPPPAPGTEVIHGPTDARVFPSQVGGVRRTRA